MIEIKHLELEIDNKTILKDINFDVYDGEIISIIGPSGCGKSSILKSIVGIIKNHSGKIILDNVDVTDTPINIRNINLVFQDFSLFPHMTVYENMQIASKDDRLINYVLDELELSHLKEKYSNQMSGGEQQRCAIARSIIYNPKVLLLDEPFSNIDKITTNTIRLKILKLLKEFKISTIMVTHDLEDVCIMSDRCIVMDKSIIVQQGFLENLYSNPISLFVGNLFGDLILVDEQYYRPENIKISKIWKVDHKPYYIKSIKFNKDYNVLTVETSKNESLIIFDYLRLDIEIDDKIYLKFENPLKFIN